MSVKSTMLEQLAISRRIVTDGHENIPAWRIETTDGAWLILTRFDPAKPGHSDRALYLMKRFMAWKFAQAFVMTAETWLAGPRQGEEAVTAVGCSRSERLGVIQRIRRDGAAVEFGPLEWLAQEQMDSLYWTLLPGREETITAKEAAELAAIFAESGELPAQKLN
jgi:hypothetical protein